MIESIGAQWYWLGFLGVAAGIISGALGVGSGIVLVPALTLLLGFAQKQAQGTALSVMVAMALVGALRYHINPDIKLSWTLILILAGGAVLGSLIGSQIAFALPGGALKKVFAVFIIVVGIRMLLK